MWLFLPCGCPTWMCWMSSFVQRVGDSAFAFVKCVHVYPGDQGNARIAHMLFPSDCQRAGRALEGLKG